MKRFEQIHYLSWDHRNALLESFKILKYIDSFSEEEILNKKDFILKFYELDLLLHFRTEEECLLSRIILKHDANTDYVRKTFDDHLLIHSLIVLLKREIDAKKLKIVLKEFAKNLQEHIRFEERQLFEHSQLILSETDFIEIQKEILERYGDKYKSFSCQLPEVE